MQRVSSNLTLALKIFLPTVWVTFFGLFTIAILFAENANLPFGGGNFIRVGFLVGFLLFLLLMYVSVLRLKRVEFGDDGIYISNYFKTYRYKYIDIESIKESDYLILKIAVIKLKEKGQLGLKLPFVISSVHYDDFIKNHPSYFEHLS